MPPLSILAPAAGLVDNTLPTGWVLISVATVPTLSPSFCRAVLATTRDCPTTLGTGIVEPPMTPMERSKKNAITANTTNSAIQEGDEPAGPLLLFEVRLARGRAVAHRDRLGLRGDDPGRTEWDHDPGEGGSPASTGLPRSKRKRSLRNSSAVA